MKNKKASAYRPRATHSMIHPAVHVHTTTSILTLEENYTVISQQTEKGIAEVGR